MSSLNNGGDSSSNQLTKEEKLKRRQERLAAWKSKNGEGSNDQISREDNLKKRQAQLEAWKQRKQREEVGSSSPSPAAPSADDKQLSRQQKIEEWKRKRLQNKTEAVAKLTQSKISIKAPKIVKPKSNGLLKKRSAFENEEDDEQNSKPVFKKPTLGNDRTNSQSDEGEDELDLFLQNLDHSLDDQGKGLQKVEDVHEEEEEAEDEDQDEEQKKLFQLTEKISNKEKELEVIDHSSIQYDSFRKNFYKPPIEIEKLLREDIADSRSDLQDIKVRGVDCPRPILKWAHLGLPQPIMEVIEDKLKYPKPSAIQAQALPAIMSGRDVIGIAKTGSGKTITFVLPMLRHIKDQKALKRGEGPIGLIMSPTRELAIQINKELNHFTKSLGLTSCCCYGGANIENQISELKKGAEIIVGTPGRIIDLLAANGGRVTNLKRVTYTVLDEADRMFDMGFEPQVSKIFSQIRPDKQTLLFSATFPRQMELLAKKILNNPIEISVGGISVVASEISQQIELFEVNKHENNLDELLEISKFNKLIQIVKDYHQTKILIFVEKQNSADELLVKLLGYNYACLAIHGGKEQIDRKYAIKEFSSMNSGVNILIATSIAARGLDVKGLDLVINYDAPNHMEDYVHRVGRTGRAGKKGTAITFVTSKQERSITDLVKAMKFLQQDQIEPRLIEISNAFLKKVKSGKEKYYFGFGGRGLDNLQEIRENNRDLERKVFNEDDSNEPSTTKSFQLPDFQIIQGRANETAGPERCKYHSRIQINDLPQKTRWLVSKSDNLNKIIELTSTSITNKGQYYAPNTKIPNKSDPPKLYLLVEGLTEKSVRDANNMIRQSMIEGLEAVARDQNIAPTGKYTV